MALPVGEIEVDFGGEGTAAASLRSSSSRSSASGGSLSSSNAFRASAHTVFSSEEVYDQSAILILAYWLGWSSNVGIFAEVLRPT